MDNDEENWEVLSGLPAPHGQELLGVNLANYFSSYLFGMNGRNTYSALSGELQETGETERFSMSMIFGISENDIFRRKKTVQQIYNANYRFAKPPDKPILTAVPGDGRVTLFWDDRAEKTFDPFYQRINFEGYRVYRSTEPNFLENKIITDAFGKPTFREPIAQFDLIDGEKDLHPIDVNGAMFYLGDDSGIKHSFIDSTVQNGQTYYYAVAAYDKGFVTTTIEGNVEGIPPSETTTILKKDITGEITTDINTAVVTPRAPAAGYIAPQIQSFLASGPSSSKISVSVLDPDSIKDMQTYRVEFSESSLYNNSPTADYTLTNEVTGDTLVTSSINNTENQTKVVDGFAIDMTVDTVVSLDFDKSRWISGNSNYNVLVGFDSRFSAGYQSRKIDYPADFEIHFTEPGMGDLSFPATSFSKAIQSNIIIKNLTEEIDHFQFIFRDENKDEIFNDSDAVFLVFGDSAGREATGFSDFKVSWSMTLQSDTNLPASEYVAPQPGDIYKIVTNKPVRDGEFFEFTTKAQAIDHSSATSDLDEIAVVPNPYVGAASWEAVTTNVGRGERKIYFINLPNECSIRIYTLSGKLVDTIHHSSVISDGQASWDLITKDGMNVAYGIYVYHVDAPGIGEKIGKFGIIK